MASPDMPRPSSSLIRARRRSMSTLVARRGTESQVDDLASDAEACGSKTASSGALSSAIRYVSAPRPRSHHRGSPARPAHRRAPGREPPELLGDVAGEHRAACSEPGRARTPAPPPPPPRSPPSGSRLPAPSASRPSSWAACSEPDRQRRRRDRRAAPPRRAGSRSPRSPPTRVTRDRAPGPRAPRPRQRRRGCCRPREP